MTGNDRSARDSAFLRMGGLCAVVGAVVSVAAGIGFGNRTTGAEAEEVLRYIAAQPSWYWPAVHLGFITGALLWLAAFMALTVSLNRTAGRELALLGAASVVLGATLHVVDSSINGFGLATLAEAWAAAHASVRPELIPCCWSSAAPGRA